MSTRRPGLAQLYRETLANAEADHAERRKLVLEHDDLARRLTLPPLGYREARQWTGFIPPFMIEGPFDAANDRNTWIRNPSAQRVHLVAITHEAYARTYGEDIGHAWLAEINTNQWADDWSPHDAMAKAAKRLGREVPAWIKE